MLGFLQDGSGVQKADRLAGNGGRAGQRAHGLLGRRLELVRHVHVAERVLAADVVYRQPLDARDALALRHCEPHLSVVIPFQNIRP